MLHCSIHFPEFLLKSQGMSEVFCVYPTSLHLTSLSFLLISSVNSQHHSRKQINLLVPWCKYLVIRLLISSKLAFIVSECKVILELPYIPWQLVPLGRLLH